MTESFAIAGLPDSIREKCRQANINAKSTLLEIARQFDEKAMHDFLDDIRKQGLTRDEIRQTARADKKFKDKILSENKISLANKKSKNNYFQYISKEKDFSLEIRFNKITDYQKQDVLRALKEAFESVKN